jgi:hypothetical protein
MHTSRPMLENDLVGVGVGPTNLSLASLIETARVSGLAHFQSKFLEKNRAIRWHSGQLFPGTLMQTEFYPFGHQRSCSGRMPSNRVCGRPGSQGSALDPLLGAV